jgi:hypothetical protein
MGKKDDKDKSPDHPKDAAKWGSQKGTNDAFCTECTTWYDSTNDAQVNRHAH